MATFEQLSAEQRAIIELVLKQGQSYGQLGEMLNMPEERVRELARESLVTLSPVSAAAVDDDRRGPLADYLLGQQSESGSAATRAHMERSEAARAWSRSLLDSLEQFYDAASLPVIPEAGEKKRAGKQASPRPPREQLSPEARTIVRQRRIAGAAGFVVFALFALLVWPVGVLTGGGEDKESGSKAKRRPPARVVGQLVLRPADGSKGQGVAVIAQRGKSLSLIVQAKLPASANREAYEVWLYDSDRDADSLGAQVTDGRGAFQGQVELPKNFARFKFIDISRENVDSAGTHSGDSILRGRIDQFQLPANGAQGGTPRTETQP